MIKIGGIELSGLAAPEFWPLGGEQKITVKELTGGSVTYQPRGYFPHLEHSWDGVLEGKDAKKKADALNKLSQSGKSVEVKFYNFTFRYFVNDFKYDWMRPDWIEFNIKVLRDTTPVKSQKASTPDPIKKALESKPPPTPAAKETIYVVTAGDTLRKIAARELGNVNLHEKIFKDNKKIIKDPNRIFPGQKLVIKK